MEKTEIRIAVVDDENLLLTAFSSLMRQYGYKADFFSDPVAALESILGNPGRYHLVIADIKMPQMDGVTFVKKLRFVLPNLPIIFMTGYGNEDLRQQSMALGKIVYLEKPFPLEATLKEAIPKLLETA